MATLIDHPTGNPGTEIDLTVREIWHRRRAPEGIAVVTQRGWVKFFDLSSTIKDLEDPEDFLIGNGFTRWISQTRAVKIPVYGTKEEQLRRRLRGFLEDELMAQIEYGEAIDLANETGYPDIALGLKQIRDDEKKHKDAIELMLVGLGRVKEE